MQTYSPLQRKNLYSPLLLYCYHLDACFEPYVHRVTINDGPNKGLTSHSRTEDNTFNLRGYDIETKEIIEEDKPWTPEWFGYTKKELEDIHDTSINNTEDIYVQTMEELGMMLENQTILFDTQEIYQDNIDDENMTIQDEQDLNDIINKISYSPSKTNTLGKNEFKKLIREGTQESIVMNILQEDPKMMDGGANRNITDKKEILHRYRKL